MWALCARISTIVQAYQLVQHLDRSQGFSFIRRTCYRNNTNKAITVKSQPSQSQSVPFWTGNPTQKRDDKGKGVYSESSRSGQHNRCFKCQRFGHIVAQYPSKTRTLIIETQSDNYYDDLEESGHDPEGDVWEDELVVDQATTLVYLSSMHPPSIDNVNEITCRLSVVWCTLAQPKKSDDWRRSTIFQTLTKISDKNYQIIIDSESCVNIVALNMVTKIWAESCAPSSTT